MSKVPIRIISVVAASFMMLSSVYASNTIDRKDVPEEVYELIKDIEGKVVKNDRYDKPINDAADDDKSETIRATDSSNKPGDATHDGERQAESGVSDAYENGRSSSKEEIKESGNKISIGIDRTSVPEGETAKINVSGISADDMEEIYITVNSDLKNDIITEPYFDGGSVISCETLFPASGNDYYTSMIRVLSDEEMIDQTGNAEFGITGSYVSNTEPVVVMIAFIDENGSYKYYDETFYMTVTEKNGDNNRENEPVDSGEPKDIDSNDGSGAVTEDEAAHDTKESVPEKNKDNDVLDKNKEVTDKPETDEKISDKMNIVGAADIKIDKETLKVGESATVKVTNIDAKNVNNLTICLISDIKSSVEKSLNFQGASLTGIGTKGKSDTVDYYSSFMEYSCTGSDIISDGIGSFKIYGEKAGDNIPVVVLIAFSDNNGEFKYLDKTFYLNIEESEREDPNSDNKETVHEENNDRKKEEATEKERTAEKGESNTNKADVTESENADIAPESETDIEDPNTGDDFNILLPAFLGLIVFTMLKMGFKLTERKD